MGFEAPKIVGLLGVSMAYTKFQSGKPDIADSGGVVIDDTRENLMALRDAPN